MALFKRRNIAKILSGEKTQTRRVHRHAWKIGKVYGLRDQWFTPKEKAAGAIQITRMFRQRLGSISQEDVEKEGFTALEEFQAEWAQLHGSWDPDEVVTVYEFTVLKDFPQNKGLNTTIVLYYSSEVKMMKNMREENKFKGLIEKALNLSLGERMLAYAKARNEIVKAHGVNVHEDVDFQEMQEEVGKLIAERRAKRKAKFEAANGEYAKYADAEYKTAGEQIKALEGLVY